MTRIKPTIADLRARKGKGQLTMLRVMSLEEAAAAEAAGIDIVSVPAELVTHPLYREVAPTLFSMTGKTHLEAGTRDDYLRWACKVMLAGADADYCSGGLGTVEHVAREHIPVVGHVGLVPSRSTWTGGMNAVAKVEVSLDGGKTWQLARMVGPDLGRFAWRQFVFAARLPAGQFTLASRATDTAGNVQPEQRMENAGGYNNTSWADHAVKVSVA